MPIVIWIAFLALPYFVRSRVGLPSHSSYLGAIPKGAGKMAMTAALGPAALLMTPQGKAAVAKGIVLAKNARSGDPKAKTKVKQVQVKAKQGDPKAKKELAALQAAEAVRQAALADELDEDDDFLDEDEDDEDDYE